MGAAIALMETSPGDENINDDVKLCLFFNSNIAADLAKSHKDQPNGIIWMPICTQLRGPIPTYTKGITLCGLGTYDIFANHVLVNRSCVCKPCDPCQSACKHIIVHRSGACEHIICLQASS
jgi:hypothetical protein